LAIIHKRTLAKFGYRSERKVQKCRNHAEAPKSRRLKNLKTKTA
jgi:hypothetical protein